MHSSIIFQANAQMGEVGSGMRMICFGSLPLQNVTVQITKQA